MLSFQSLRSSTLSLALLPLLASPLLAQDPLVPLGPVVEIDQECVSRPAVLASEGQVVVVWSRSAGPAGIFARVGASLDALGPEVQLASPNAAREVALAAQPGGFVLAWNSFGEPSFARYQRFGFDLAPLAPAVELGRAYAGQSPALLVDAAGEVTFSYFDFSAGNDLRIQRFSAADTPLTALLYVDAASGSTTPNATVRLAAGETNFLVAWSGGSPGLTGGPALWVRPMGWDALPAGPSSVLGSLGGPDFDVAWAQGSYLVVRVYAGELWAHPVAADGTPIGAGEVLIPSVSPFGVRLAPNGENLWLTLGIQADPGLTAGLYAARIAMPEVAAGPLDLLVRGPEDPNQFNNPGGSAATGDGLLFTWGFGAVSSPVPMACVQAQAVRARAFGALPLVAVPTLALPGLVALALLVAAGGLMLLRR